MKAVTMKKRLMNKIFSVVICICIVASCACFPAFAEGEIITISNADAFEQLVKDCGLDTWSQGKNVILDADIDFTGRSFSPVPIFCGNFDGQGHTLSGLNYYGYGAIMGVFRYLGGGAVIKSLNVNANIYPVGTKETIGGIVGENNGTIADCNFNGSIKASKNVGAITGVNQGNIINCSAQGDIYAEHYVGGIAGKNLSSISLCKNSANVNVYTEEVKLDLDDINTDKLLSLENTVDITDVGGIAGYSSGMVQSCENSATIGYEHVGYNIGGICGRQTGYINNCTNSGRIYGRKDVGGICGQTEPYTVLEYSQSGLESLQSQLDTLETLVDNASKNADSTRNLLSGNLSETKKYISDARLAAQNILDNAQNKTNSAIDKGNGAIQKIDNVSADLADMVDGQVDIADNISKSADNISSIVDEYGKAADDIKEIWQNADVSEIKYGIGALSVAVKDMATAAKSLQRAMSLVENAFGNADKLDLALSQFQTASNDMEKAIDNVNSALASISAATDTLGKSGNIPSGLQSYFADIKTNLDKIAQNNASVKNALNEYTTGFESLRGYLKTLDLQSLVNAVGQIYKATEKFYTSIADVSSSLRNFQNAADTIQKAIDDTKGVVQNTDGNRKKLGDEFDTIVAQLDKARGLVRDFSAKSNISFDKLDNISFEMRDSLSNAISNLSNSTDSIFDNITAFGDSFSGNLTAVKNQISSILDTMVDSVNNTQDKSADVRDYIEDVSEFDSSQKQGKISQSVNRGDVSGDINVGGVTGSMAIEYDFDPEDDVSTKGNKSLDFMYTTKSIVIGCSSNANITSRKNCVAAICGKQDLGMIKDCIATGTSKSESGNYCGGIAGQSGSLIRECYAKLTLEGDNYVGGIAGDAQRINGCYAIAHISRFNEYGGSIAGKAKGKFTSNYFVGELGGIDAISYAGGAQAISFDELKALANVPYDLKYFALTFKADGETTEVLYFNYGGSLDKAVIPQVPKKDGCYGIWERENFDNLTYDETINAYYDKYVGAVESTQQRDNGLPCIVVEGELSAESKLHTNATKQGVDGESWEISVSDCDGDSAKVHYLPQPHMGKMKVHVYEDGKWRKVKYKKDGSYLVFEASPCVSAFTAERAIPLWIIMFLILLVFAFVGVLLLKTLHLKKNVFKS